MMNIAEYIALGGGSLGGLTTVVSVVRYWIKTRYKENREAAARAAKRVDTLLDQINEARTECDQRIDRAIAQERKHCDDQLEQIRADVETVVEVAIRQLQPDDTSRHKLEEIRARTPTPKTSQPPVSDSELPPAARRARVALREKADDDNDS